ncbi:MAG: nicotinate (nicotinamide) nucleotide adenylyltransferase [Puniceicoccaceae bacterium]
MRIGLLGGTFDPIHLGHRILAQEAFLHAQLDEVRLIPAFQAPLRSAAPAAPPAHRLEMASLTTVDLAYLKVDPREIHHQSCRYAVETIRELIRGEPHNQWFWILGADQFSRLPDWAEPDALARLVTFLVLERELSPLVPPPLAGLQYQIMPGHRFDCSASEIRLRIAQSQPWESFVLPSVVSYIKRHQLYQGSSVS